MGDPCRTGNHWQMGNRRTIFERAIIELEIVEPAIVGEFAIVKPAIVIKCGGELSNDHRTSNQQTGNHRTGNRWQTGDRRRTGNLWQMGNRQTIVEWTIVELEIVEPGIVGKRAIVEPAIIGKRAIVKLVKVGKCGGQLSNDRRTDNRRTGNCRTGIVGKRAIVEPVVVGKWAFEPVYRRSNNCWQMGNRRTGNCRTGNCRSAKRKNGELIIKLLLTVSLVLFILQLHHDEETNVHCFFLSSKVSEYGVEVDRR